MPGTVRHADRDRYWILLVALALSLVGLGVRLVWIQGIEGPAYARKAAEQRTRDMVITPKRGVIYDREGQPLAASFEARTIYAVPSAVKDPEGTARKLAGVLGGKPETFAKKLARKSSFVYIARKVELERAKRIEDMRVPGIGFLEDSKRVYPSGELACQVLGFVDIDDKGIAGIEKQYDEILRGKPGSVLAERDPYGRPIPGAATRSIDRVDGRDIVLTIDKDIQYQAQLELAETVRKFGAKDGSVVVMDPRDGSILAMASALTFNPNDRNGADPRAFNNRPVVQPYEPGSTVKPFTAAAVIDKGIFTPASRFDLPSTIRIGGRVIGEAHDRPSVDYSLADIIAYSSNVGAVRLGLALGKQGVWDYFTRFGFDAKTGIDFPGESAGMVPEPGRWSSSSIGNIPFGQGMTATPLQLARALAGVAGGGEIVTPHLLMTVAGEKPPVWPRKRAVSAETAKQMTAVLRQVVDSGTGTAARVPGYEVAGKTGTAQVAKGGGYADDAYVSSFIGFLPANDPRVLVVVVIEEPTNAIYGGTVAAPAFSRLAQFAVDHLKIPPTALPTSGKQRPKAPAVPARD